MAEEQAILIPGDKETFLKAQKDLQKQQKEFEENFRKDHKDYEPYELSEIKIKIQEVKEQTKKKKIKHKLKAFKVALARIKSIIQNSELLYEKLSIKGDLDDPDHYFCELTEANNLKRHFEIEIAELEDLLKSESNLLKCNFTLDEAAEEIGCSSNTLYHVLGKTNDEFKSGGRYHIRKDQIPEIIQLMNSKSSSVEESIPVTKKKTKKENHFTFTVPLEPFTNAFVDEGYLDKDNALLMNDRFSKEPKLSMDNNKIQWKKDLKSLLTFIYLSDRLDYLDKSSSSNTRGYSKFLYKFKEIINEDAVELKSVFFQIFVLENFNVSKGGKGEASISRGWKKINEAVCELCKQVINKKLSKEYVISRKDGIELYFKNCEKEKFRINENKDCDIDTKMLEIVGKIFNKKN
jgi:hypothetical protein